MKERITISIDKNILSVIDSQAKKESRSRSNMVEMFLYAQMKIEDLSPDADPVRADKTGF